MYAISRVSDMDETGGSRGIQSGGTGATETGGTEGTGINGTGDIETRGTGEAALEYTGHVVSRRPARDDSDTAIENSRFAPTNDTSSVHVYNVTARDLQYSENTDYCGLVGKSEVEIIVDTANSDHVYNDLARGQRYREESRQKHGDYCDLHLRSEIGLDLANVVVSVPVSAVPISDGYAELARPGNVYNEIDDGSENAEIARSDNVYSEIDGSETAASNPTSDSNFGSIGEDNDVKYTYVDMKSPDSMETAQQQSLALSQASSLSVHALPALFIF